MRGRTSYEAQKWHETGFSGLMSLLFWSQNRFLFGTVFTHPQSVLFPKYCRPSFTPIQKNYSSYILISYCNCYFLKQMISSVPYGLRVLFIAADISGGLATIAECLQCLEPCFTILWNAGRSYLIRTSLYFPSVCGMKADSRTMVLWKCLYHSTNVMSRHTRKQTSNC